MSFPKPIYANPEHPILDEMVRRWSPYRYLPKQVEPEKLHSLFEAARWAASSYNDQPWSFLVAQRNDEAEFEKALSCLVEANQAWAKQAGVLVLTVIRTTFRQNDKPNRVALHDLGAAAAQMALQAVPLGLAIHQMAGVNLSRIRSVYAVPEGFEPATGIAIGYPDLSEPDPENELGKRDATPRARLPLVEQVFEGGWGKPASWL